MLGIVNCVLDAWGLPYSQKFLSPDGLVVIGLLCNAAAKDQEWGAFREWCWPYFYDLKPEIVELAAKKHTHVWKEIDGGSYIVYFETCVGQISFHVFPEESDFWELLPDANGRQWAGGYMQDNARALALAFVNETNDYLEYECQRFLANAQGF